MDALLQERMKAGQKVHFEYVKGHAGERGNEGADYQANRGCELPSRPDRDWAKLEAEVRQRIGAAPVYKAPLDDPASAVVETAPRSSSVGIGISLEELEVSGCCLLCHIITELHAQAMKEFVTDDIEADLSE